MVEDKQKFDHKARQAEHMARRRSHGLSYRDLEYEFDTGKSTIHRKLKTKLKQEDD